ncbi:unnamed protein product, partial [Thlaspi arvense]
QCRTLIYSSSSRCSTLFLIPATARHHQNFSHGIHMGIAVLIYKLTKEKTCAGANGFFSGRAIVLYCSFVMEFDLHTILDSAVNLRPTYMEDEDNFAIYYVVIPCAVVSILIHPSTRHHIINRLIWALCVYLEAVSVLPQLSVMQNTKVLDLRGRLLTALGYGLWPLMALLCEIIQTFVLADFCYYYVQSLMGGQLVLSLPSGVV